MATETDNAAEAAASKPEAREAGAPVETPASVSGTEPEHAENSTGAKAPAEEKRGPGRPRKVRPGVSEKAVTDERARAQKLAALEKGRKTLADKRAAAEPADKPETIRPEVFEHGCSLFIRALWMVCRLGARIAGGRLAPLREEDVRAGVLEAKPLLKRFPFMVSLLSFFGLPLWLGHTIAFHFQKKADAPAAPEEKKPLSVVSGGMPS